MNYIFHILITVGIYTMLGLSLNLIVGYGGMLTLCHAAFYGIGAYVSALLAVNVGFHFVWCLIIAAVVTAIVAYSISIPTIRLQGDFFVLATLGFQMIVFSILNNCTELTRGPYGILGIPRPSFFGFTISTPGLFLTLTLVGVSLVCFEMKLLTHSPYARTLQGVRDDDVAASALGKNVVKFKRSAFVIGATIASCAGVLYAAYTRYIDPTSFTLDESVFILCVVIIGGAGNLRGPIVGAIILVLLPELLRFLKIPDAVAANARQVLYGLLLVGMMRFRPQGIAGKYAFD